MTCKSWFIAKCNLKFEQYHGFSDGKVQVLCVAAVWPNVHTKMQSLPCYSCETKATKFLCLQWTIQRYKVVHFFHYLVFKYMGCYFCVALHQIGKSWNVCCETFVLVFFRAREFVAAIITNLCCTAFRCCSYCSLALLCSSYYCNVTFYHVKQSACNAITP